MILTNQYYDKSQRELWEILKSYPNYFDDTLHIETFYDFEKWWKEEIIDYVIGIDEAVFGFGYLTSLENGNGCINLVMKRKAIPFPVAIELYKKYMNYFIDKYNLKMLYAIVRVNNLACLQLLKILGFKITTTLEKHEVVNGKLIDCFIATYIREFK